MRRDRKSDNNELFEPRCKSLTPKSCVVENANQKDWQKGRGIEKQKTDGRAEGQNGGREGRQNVGREGTRRKTGWLEIPAILSVFGTGCLLLFQHE